MDNHDQIVSRIEFQHGLRAVESEAKGLFYLTDNERKSIGIMTCKFGGRSICVLSKKQVHALLNELKAVCDLFWEG